MADGALLLTTSGCPALSQTGARRRGRVARVDTGDTGKGGGDGAGQLEQARGQVVVP